jgi:hypothetical protein
MVPKQIVKKVGWRGISWRNLMGDLSFPLWESSTFSPAHYNYISATVKITLNKNRNLLMEGLSTCENEPKLIANYFSCLFVALMNFV